MLNEIKEDFRSNRIKLAIIGIAIILWTIGFINHDVQLYGGILINMLALLFFLSGIYLISGSHIYRGRPKTWFVVLIAFFLFIIAYKYWLKRDYAIENDAVLLPMLIFGVLPYACAGKKTAGTAIGAAITGLFAALLAGRELWWSVIAASYLAVFIQIVVAALGAFGGRRIIRVAEAAVFNSAAIIIVLKLSAYPGIAPSFVPLSTQELVCVGLLLMFVVCSAVCVLRSNRRRYCAIAGIIAVTVQATLYIAAKGNPLFAACPGLPFVHSSAVNFAFSGSIVGLILAPESLCIYAGKEDAHS